MAASDNLNSLKTKAQWRQYAKAVKPSLNIPNLSNLICSHIETLQWFQKAERILLYYPINNEIDCRELVNRHPDKTYYLPKITGPKQMHFIKIDIKKGSHQWRHLSPHPRFNVPEPDTGEIFNSDCLTQGLVIVPALAADESGHRLGYGQGFYDRFLSPLQNYAPIQTVGVVPELLRVPALPTDPWDEPLDAVITENCVYLTSAKSNSLS